MVAGNYKMQTTYDALSDGFTPDINNMAFVFRFGDNREYELCFEPLLFDNQMYVALYKNRELLTNKVVVKPGYERPEQWGITPRSEQKA